MNETRNAINRKLVVSGILVLTVALASIVHSHCQIPCGIYNGPARFDMIAENITTIEKSMRQITELSQKDGFRLIQIGGAW